MKTLKIFSFAFWLLFTSFSLTGQNHEAVSAKSEIGEVPVFVSDTLCQALFSASPDSLSSYPFYYHFKDLSSGALNFWHWDFGDGTTSTEQNPSHQYDKPGTYKVCLIVADQNDTADCSDQICQEIITLDYHSLGGTVYAGEYPLNSPVVGDTGMASLYRIVNQQIVFVEDNYFQDYGYYWFGYLIPGEYIVKIGLTEGSANYKNYFTTYFGNDISWTKADLLSVSTISLYAADINLKPVQKLPAGQGIIKGYVNFEQGNTFSMPPISQTTVILSDFNHNPLQFTRPNLSGYFEFTGIPYDTYFLTADATGKPASTVTFTLTESSPVVEGINLTVFGSNVSIIPEVYGNGISFTRIYPNPVRDNLYISLYSGMSAPVNIKVVDVTGKTYINLTETLKAGFSQILIPAATLPPGIFLLVLQAQGSYMPVTAKFIK